MDLKLAFQKVCDGCGKHDEKERLSTSDPIAQAVIENLDLIARWLRERFETFSGRSIEIEYSKGVGNFPKVPWVCLLPPGQQIKDGVYAGICFGKDGKGAVVGCLQSVNAPKGLSTIARAGNGKIPAIDVDGSNLNTRFNNAFANPDVIRKAVGQSGNLDGIDVAHLLVTINDRIELLYDRDHQIGHAFFLKVKSLLDLRDVFYDRVIPLLQEYFYGDWGKVCLAARGERRFFVASLGSRGAAHARAAIG